MSGSSPLHRLDARAKLVLFFGLIVGIVLTPERAWPAYPLLWALIGILAGLGQIGVGRLARLGTLALPFVLAASTLLFTLPGAPVMALGPLTITDAGIARFGSILLKSWLAAQAALLLSLSTPFPDLLWALDSLHVPGTLVAIISFMVRYLSTLQDETQRLIRARAARSGQTPGSPSGGSLIWRARIAGWIVGSLFLRSIERSERIYAAMLARGYTGQMKKLDPPPLTRRAVLMGAIPLAVLLIIEVFAFAIWS